MEMAATGQERTQAPQPLQAEASTCTDEDAGRTVKRMAPRSHTSAQARHSTLRRARQLLASCGCRRHVGRAVDSARGVQAWAHAPQKVHSPALNDTSG